MNLLPEVREKVDRPFSVKLAETPTPSLGKGQVLLRIVCVGLDGKGKEIYEGV